MRYVEHHVECNRPNEQGVRLRDIYAEKARRGDATARDLLAGPPYPRELAYLDGWSQELCGRSGASMSGIAPLSYATISDWSRLTGREPTMLEIEALLLLDGVRLAPPANPYVEESPEPDAPKVAKVGAWPSKREEPIDE